MLFSVLGRDNFFSNYQKTHGFPGGIEVNSFAYIRLIFKAKFGEFPYSFTHYIVTVAIFLNLGSGHTTGRSGL